MPEGLPIAKGKEVCAILQNMANRHGLIAGATGTGKTVTLRVIAENFSRAGVPVFMADVKGDLSGIARRGQENPKISERLKSAWGRRGISIQRLSDGFLGPVRTTRPSRAHDHFRHGAAAFVAPAQFERNSKRRAEPGFQNRRRQRHAPARSKRSARHASACWR